MGRVTAKRGEKREKREKGENPAAPVVELATGIKGLRLVRGRGVTFPRPREIVHADYAIKLTTAGTGAPLQYRGVHHSACREGSLSAFAPFEPLLADTSTRSTSFTSLLVDPSLIERACEAMEQSSGSLFHNPHIFATGLPRALAALCRTISRKRPPQDLELQLAEVLERLLATQQHCRERHLPVPALRRVREAILDHLDENISLETLEQEAGLSRFHLIRAFRKYFGLPPGEFRARARIALARKLLAGGYSQADAAQAVGFFDQSHFHRHFRRATGISPGTFQKALDTIAE